MHSFLIDCTEENHGFNIFDVEYLPTQPSETASLRKRETTAYRISANDTARINKTRII